TMSGIYIEELTDEYCLCSMKIEDVHRNALGGVMGGAIFTLADLAFSAACNNAHKPTVALQTSVSYLSMAKGETLFARAECVKDGRTTAVYNIDVTDDTGRHIAKVAATGYKLGV
ncbi:MAG: PaaI family thioesterase, partial [Ruminococcus sp.]|nr:PaaI family thioesterase [Ruminococcus sp.]